MSVLIKGMEMPKRCVECEWHEYYGGDYDWVHACRRTGTMPIGNADTERANDCPLTEIPEHGRLIDADALKETLDYYICEANWGDEVNKGLRWVKDEFINSENTVIEPEEGSEDK